MSVFTPVSDAEARALLEHYTLGDLESLEGIAQGVEDTNYFLTTTTGEYVLTLFQHIPRAHLPSYVGLMDHLAHHDVICPAPMRRDDGEMLTDVNGKPAAIVSRLPGAPKAKPDEHTCRAAGRILGGLHVAAVDYDASLENARGRAWRESFAQQLKPRLSKAQNELIAAENAYQAIHDDWCVNPDATLDHARAHAFLRGYHTERPLESFERSLWPVMLRRAALRTWLGRLGYNYFPRDSEMTIPKDHEFSRRLLEHHIEHARGLEDTLD